MYEEVAKYRLKKRRRKEQWRRRTLLFYMEEETIAWGRVVNRGENNGHKRQAPETYLREHCPCFRKRVFDSYSNIPVRKLFYINMHEIFMVSLRWCNVRCIYGGLVECGSFPSQSYCTGQLPNPGIHGGVGKCRAFLAFACFAVLKLVCWYIL